MTYRPKFDWTDARCARLTELWRKGYSAGVIALEFGCSRNAVIGKVHRLKLPTRNGADRESQRVVSKMYAKRIKRTSAQRYGLGKSAHVAPRVAKLVDPLPMPPPEAPTASAVKFEDLAAHHCRWIYGDGETRMFCGCQTVPGKSWCSAHMARVYTPIRLAERPKEPERQKTFYDMKELA